MIVRQDSSLHIRIIFLADKSFQILVHLLLGQYSVKINQPSNEAEEFPLCHKPFFFFFHFFFRFFFKLFKFFHFYKPTFCESDRRGYETQNGISRIVMLYLSHRISILQNPWRKVAGRYSSQPRIFIWCRSSVKASTNGAKQ